MTRVRAERHVVARLQIPRARLAFDPQTRASAENDHPLVGLLREPLARRRHLAGRHDALDAGTGRADEDVDPFGGKALGKVVEKVAQVVSIAS
jgi:hypothetical protein